MRQVIKLAPYEKGVYQFLYVYRFFTFAIAVIVLQVIPSETSSPPSADIYALLSSIGVYSIWKLLSPFRFRQKGTIVYLDLAIDLAICIFLLLYTNGLDSGFLLYSLIPVITAALLFEQRVALVTATLLCLPLVIAHMALSQASENYVWILEGNYIILLIIYVIVCFLIATSAYRTNLNIYRRIESGATLEERRRMGKELHDTIVQVLGYLKIKTVLIRDFVSEGETGKAIADLTDMQKVVEDAYQDSREAIDSLRTEIERIPLIPALARYIQDFEQRSGIPTEFHPPIPSVTFPASTEIQLLRIVQEALTNIRKHARASRSWVRISRTAKGWDMVIEDNGQGFQSAHQEGNIHHGLEIMKERAESIGGAFSIDTIQGQGTKITVRLPR